MRLYMLWVQIQFTPLMWALIGVVCTYIDKLLEIIWSWFGNLQLFRCPVTIYVDALCLVLFV